MDLRYQLKLAYYFKSNDENLINNIIIVGGMANNILNSKKMACNIGKSIYEENTVKKLSKIFLIDAKKLNPAKILHTL